MKKILASLDKIALIILGLSVILFVIIPLFDSECIHGWSSSLNNLTTPVISIASALLVYVSFLKQVDANKELLKRQDSDQKRQDRLYEIEEVRNSRERTDELIKRINKLNATLFENESNIFNYKSKLVGQIFLDVLKDNAEHLKKTPTEGAFLNCLDSISKLNGILLNFRTDIGLVYKSFKESKNIINAFDKEQLSHTYSLPEGITKLRLTEMEENIDVVVSSKYYDAKYNPLINTVKSHSAEILKRLKYIRDFISYNRE